MEDMHNLEVEVAISKLFYFTVRQALLPLLGLT